MNESFSPDIRTLRLGARMDLLQPDPEAEPEPVMLTALNASVISLRTRSERKAGERLRLQGQPNFHESYIFEARVESARHVQLPAQQLDYYELKVQVAEKDSFRRFAAALRRTALELKEDLRLGAQWPVELDLDGETISTRTENISYGGVYLSFGEVLYRIESGQNYPLILKPPDGKRIFHAQGKAVHRTLPEEAALFGVLTGVGFRLSFPDKDAKQLWRDAVAALHEGLENE